MLSLKPRGERKLQLSAAEALYVNLEKKPPEEDFSPEDALPEAAATALALSSEMAVVSAAAVLAFTADGRSCPTAKYVLLQ